jgi:UDPglucose 6-dehydrogenase
MAEHKEGLDMAMRITVIGTGYLGATHAACMAELGFDVLGVDVDSAKIATLTEGRLPFYEAGLEDLIRRHVGLGRLRFTTSLAQAAEFGDVHFLCVGTPQRPDGEATDLSQINTAVASLAPHLQRPCLIVGKSTVPAGTARGLARRIREAAPVGELAEVAWNPEFLREGYAVADTICPDRLVFGVQSDWALDILKQLYADLIQRRTPVVVTDIETAELTKLAANAFLATKISFINALAEICEAVGADVVTLGSALAHDPRIGGRFLQAGAGYGGGCLPKDVRILAGQASELGMGQAAAFLREVDRTNLHCRQRLVDMTRRECGGTLNGRRICVLGAAFKPHSDDIRDSPALAIAAAIQREGAEVVIYDPIAIENAKRSYPGIGYASSVAEAAYRADVILHLTEWPEFRDIDPAALAGLVKRRCVIDGRIALDPAAWREAGWTYHAPGRPAGREEPGQLAERTAPDEEFSDARYLAAAGAEVTGAGHDPPSAESIGQ